MIADNRRAISQFPGPIRPTDRGSIMFEAGYLIQVVIILLAAVISALLFQHLRLGSTIGYLVAGAVIGPTGLRLMTDVETTRTLAGLGVVFLLFTVGLELPFGRIKVMRGRVFALGAAQVVVTAAAIAAIAFSLGTGGTVAIVIGGGLALSSTAIVLQLLSERGEMTSRFGRSAFAVLLVQDLAVAPFLVFVVALGREDTSILVALGFVGLKLAAAVLVILGLGRVVLRHLFRPVAAIRDPEIFAAFTLLVVLATGMFTEMAGLSMAFGAFLAGMLLAETQYRHQVGAVIQPFRGLLLGLFFMTVGMSIDLDLTLRQAGTIAGLVAALLVGKMVLLAVLSRAFGLSWAQSLNLGMLLSQGGEFAFVLLGVGILGGVLPVELGQLLLIVVSLTMVATPFLAWLGRTTARLVERLEVVQVEDIEEETEALSGHVVIAGLGRVGSAVAASLGAAKVPFICVDLDPHRIAQAQQRGMPVYYGDLSRPEILAALHVERARSIVVAVDNRKVALQIVALVRYIFPDMKVYASARDEDHAEELEQLGAHIVVPELVATGVKLAGSILDAVDERVAPEKP